jgi:hypothetical protein
MLRAFEISALGRCSFDRPPGVDHLTSPNLGSRQWKEDALAGANFSNAMLPSNDRGRAWTIPVLSQPRWRWLGAARPIPLGRDAERSSDNIIAPNGAITGLQ